MFSTAEPSIFNVNVNAMFSSPTRHAITADADDWSLDISLPRMSFSTLSSDDNIDRFMASTPSESVLLPGFHFSTTDENVDPAEFHRIAAQLLSGEPRRRDSAISTKPTLSMHTKQFHCDLGKDPSGRCSCSCGRSYSTSFRLRSHIQNCAGASTYPCSTCDKIFDTRNLLDRHIASRHNDNHETCPECGDMFPANQLPRHFASEFRGCDGMIQGTVGPAPEIDPGHIDSTRDSSSQHYWIYDGDLSWNQERKSTARHFRIVDNDDDDDEETGEEIDEVVEQTLSFVKDLLRRPMAEPEKKACDLCGELFDAGGDELVRHMGSHSLDFAEKRHKCDECSIYFANEKDLDRHLQSVNLNDHCGFTFLHCEDRCPGHHPPTYHTSSAPNDHDFMQRHLWAWELCQLRTHRASVAGLLAERLNTSSKDQQHMSLQDAQRTYDSMLPHINLATHSARYCPESAWLKGDLHASSSVATERLSRIMSEIYPEEDVASLRRSSDDDIQSETRPDSFMMPKEDPQQQRRFSMKRKSIVDLVKRRTSATGGGDRHSRARSNPFSFLRQHAAPRPWSMPTAKIGASQVVKLAA